MKPAPCAWSGSPLDWAVLESDEACSHYNHHINASTSRLTVVHVPPGTTCRDARTTQERAAVSASEMNRMLSDNLLLAGLTTGSWTHRLIITRVKGYTIYTTQSAPASHTWKDRPLPPDVWGNGSSGLGVKLIPTEPCRRLSGLGRVVPGCRPVWQLPTTALTRVVQVGHNHSLAVSKPQFLS